MTDTPERGQTTSHDPRHDPELPARLRAVQVRTNDLLRLRLAFVALTRLAGLVMAASCLIPITSWLAEGLSDGDLWWLGYYWPRIATGAFLLFGGGLLLALGGVLARLLVRSRPGVVACPMCRFELTTLDRGKCTECGYEVDPALPAFALSPTERVLVVRLAAFATLRLVAYALLALGLFFFATFLAKAFVPGVFTMSWEEGATMYLWLLWSVLVIAIALALLLAAGPLSALMAPKWWIKTLAGSRTETPNETKTETKTGTQAE